MDLPDVENKHVDVKTEESPEVAVATNMESSDEKMEYKSENEYKPAKAKPVENADVTKETESEVQEKINIPNGNVNQDSLEKHIAEIKSENSVAAVVENIINGENGKMVIAFSGDIQKMLTIGDNSGIPVAKTVVSDVGVEQNFVTTSEINNVKQTDIQKMLTIGEDSGIPVAKTVVSDEGGEQDFVTTAETNNVRQTDIQKLLTIGEDSGIPVAKTVVSDEGDEQDFVTTGEIDNVRQTDMQKMLKIGEDSGIPVAKTVVSDEGDEQDFVTTGEIDNVRQTNMQKMLTIGEDSGITVAKTVVNDEGGEQEFVTTAETDDARKIKIEHHDSAKSVGITNVENKNGKSEINTAPEIANAKNEELQQVVDDDEEYISTVEDNDDDWTDNDSGSWYLDGESDQDTSSRGRNVAISKGEKKLTITIAGNEQQHKQKSKKYPPPNGDKTSAKKKQISAGGVLIKKKLNEILNIESKQGATKTSDKSIIASDSTVDKVRTGKIVTTSTRPIKELSFKKEINSKRNKFEIIASDFTTTSGSTSSETDDNNFDKIRSLKRGDGIAPTGLLRDDISKQSGASAEITTIPKQLKNRNSDVILAGKLHGENIKFPLSIDGTKTKLSMTDKEQKEGVESTPLPADEDRKNPQYIPKKGGFYEHDLRNEDDDVCNSVSSTTTVDNDKELGEKHEKISGTLKPAVKPKFSDSWAHDLYDSDEQKPKSIEEIETEYGYDIRKEDSAPKTRRRKKYSGNATKYNRKSDDAEAYMKRPVKKRETQEYYVRGQGLLSSGRKPSITKQQPLIPAVTNTAKQQPSIPTVITDTTKRQPSMPTVITNTTKQQPSSIPGFTNTTTEQKQFLWSAAIESPSDDVKNLSSAMDFRTRDVKFSGTKEDANRNKIHLNESEQSGNRRRSVYDRQSSCPTSYDEWKRGGNDYYRSGDNYRRRLLETDARSFYGTSRGRGYVRNDRYGDNNRERFSQQSSNNTFRGNNLAEGYDNRQSHPQSSSRLFSGRGKISTFQRSIELRNAFNSLKSDFTTIANNANDYTTSDDTTKAVLPNKLSATTTTTTTTTTTSTTSAVAASTQSESCINKFQQQMKVDSKANNYTVRRENFNTTFNVSLTGVPNTQINTQNASTQMNKYKEMIKKFEDNFKLSDSNDSDQLQSSFVPDETDDEVAQLSAMKQKNQLKTTPNVNQSAFTSSSARASNHSVTSEPRVREPFNRRFVYPKLEQRENRFSFSNNSSFVSSSGNRSFESSLSSSKMPESLEHNQKLNERSAWKCENVDDNPTKAKKEGYDNVHHPIIRKLPIRFSARRTRHNPQNLTESIVCPKIDPPFEAEKPKTTFESPSILHAPPIVATSMIQSSLPPEQVVGHLPYYHHQGFGEERTGTAPGIYVPEPNMGPYVTFIPGAQTLMQPQPIPTATSMPYHHARMMNFPQPSGSFAPDQFLPPHATAGGQPQMIADVYDGVTYYNMHPNPGQNAATRRINAIPIIPPSVSSALPIPSVPEMPK